MKRTISKITLSVLVSSLWLSTSSYANPANSGASCTPMDQKKVAALFDRWNASLQTKSPEKVAANYAADAVLLPTVSNTPRTNHTEITNYFVTFLKANPVGTINKRIIRYGEDWASDTGLYTFQLTEHDNKTNKDKTKHVEARYSFVYECLDGKWLIVHHHSSIMPENTDIKDGSHD